MPHGYGISPEILHQDCHNIGGVSVTMHGGDAAKPQPSPGRSPHLNAGKVPRRAVRAVLRKVNMTARLSGPTRLQPLGIHNLT